MRAVSRCLGGILLLACGIVPALAQGTSGDPIIGSLPNWDYDHTGVFTCANWKRYMAQLFNRADRKKRGYIDAQEFETIKAADPMFETAEFAYFDPKGTGRLTRSDFIDWPSPFFARYDSRHTCRVARSDVNAPQPTAAAPTRRRSQR